jgi:hypothetical protein
MILKNYSPIYLKEEEFSNTLKRKIEKYDRFLGHSIFKRKGKEFWSFHKIGRQKVGHPIGSLGLVWASLVHLYNRILERLRI